MAAKPNPEFGKRRPAAPREPSPPVKRSSHVALLMMGTFAVGGAAFALMPRSNCQPQQPPPPGMAAPAVPQPSANCSSSGYSGGHWSSRSSFYSGNSSGGSSSSSSSASSSSSVSRGGFGSFAHAFGFGGS